MFPPLSRRLSLPSQTTIYYHRAAIIQFTTDVTTPSRLFCPSLHQSNYITLYLVISLMMPPISVQKYPITLYSPRQTSCVRHQQYMRARVCDRIKFNPLFKRSSRAEWTDYLMKTQPSMTRPLYGQCLKRLGLLTGQLWRLFRMMGSSSEMVDSTLLRRRHSQC